MPNVVYGVGVDEISVHACTIDAIVMGHAQHVSLKLHFAPHP